MLERIAEATARVLAALRASDVVIETPPGLVFTEREIDGLILVREAFDEAPGVSSVGLEARAYRGRPLPSCLRRGMERHGIVDVVDLSTETPRTAAPTAYSRLFGEGSGNRGSSRIPNCGRSRAERERRAPSAWSLPSTG